MIKSGEDNCRHFVQTVEYTGQDDHNSVEIISSKVNIIPSPGGHNHGSSKVKLKNIVDFTWEHRYYTGQLLAIDLSGKFMAYGIKAGTGNGVVRVVYKEHRTLIRGMRGLIQDLAFAHVLTPILACVDYTGSLFVYTIEASATEILYSRILQINADDVAPMTHRVIWCPFIPEEEVTDADEVSKLLVLTRGSKAELWSVAAASRIWAEPIQANDPQFQENHVMLELHQHNGTIIEATFSPDGTALATGSSDGEVKFFQVYLPGNAHQNGPPRCLHQWKPHDGRPISCLFFLDDHKGYNPDAQFWRFAITGCDNNSELKVWSCELWTCLQTIQFSPIPSTGKLPTLKACLDMRASYLVLSDIYNKVLYIMGITKDNDEAAACINTISEFLLPYPILSFTIIDAYYNGRRPMSESLEDLCDEDMEDQLVIRLFLVQPKSLQEGHIAFRPVKHTNNCLMDSLTQNSVNYNENLTDIETVNLNGSEIVNGEEEEEEENNDKDTMESTNHSAGLNLMTPDAFSSPAKKDNTLDSASPSPQLNVISSSPSLAQAVQALNASDPPLVASNFEDQAPPSGGSSPSREVREIMSLADPEEGESETKVESNDSGENWSNIPMGLLSSAVQDMCNASAMQNDDFVEEEDKAEKKDMPSAASATREVKNIWDLTNDIYSVANKMDSVIETMQDQRQEISELKAELARLRLQDESSSLTRVESTITRVAQQQSAKFEETVFSQMSQQLDFFKTVDSTIANKIEAVLPSSIQDFIESTKQELRIDATLVEELIKKNLSVLINGTYTREAFALAASSSVKPALECAFREAFVNILLPGFEKASQNMFKQMHETFSTGTEQYLQHVNTVMEKQFRILNAQKTEQLAATIREEIQNELSRRMTTLQETLIRTIRETVRDNLTQQLSDISGARSRATTPALPVPTGAEAQARVLSLLQRGQLNAAFQQALSASDLGLVVLVCEKTEPSRVFACTVGSPGAPRCILQQPVLLSLVQQLSADLGHRTELKHRWLEEAILNLDLADPVTREHMGSVLITLQNQLTNFVQANPNHRSTRSMKMLAMAARALLTP